MKDLVGLGKQSNSIHFSALILCLPLLFRTRFVLANVTKTAAITVILRDYGRNIYR